MSPEDNASIVLKSVDAYNDRDWERYLTFCTEDSQVYDKPTGQRFTGHQGGWAF